MISIKQLTYVLAVKKTLHFKKAAQLCHVSQSALSTAISILEKSLGAHIFERNNKKVLVTPIGNEILRRANDIMLQIEGLEHLVTMHKPPFSFPITIGVIPTIAPYLLPKILPMLNRDYPHAKIQITEDQSHILIDMLHSGMIDTALLALPYPCEGLLALEFWQEDFYWIAPKNNKHANKKEISGKQIEQCNLMLLNEGHCLKEHVLDVCKLSTNKAQHTLGATSLHTLIQMVQGHFGTTLIPAMAKEQLLAGNDTLSAVHLNEPSPHRRIAFVLRPNYTRISSIEHLVKICKKSLS